MLGLALPCILNMKVIVVMGIGMVEVGDVVDKRYAIEPAARCAIRPLKDAACGNALLAEIANMEKMAMLSEMAIPVEMTALEEIILEKATRKLATIARSQADTDLIVFTGNEQRKLSAESAKAQCQSAPLEMDICSDWQVVLLPPPPPPIRLWLLIHGPLSI